MTRVLPKVAVAAIGLMLFACGKSGNSPPITPAATQPLTSVQQVPSAVQAQASVSQARPTWDQCTDQCFKKDCAPAGSDSCRVENAPAICSFQGGACQDVGGYWLLPNQSKLTIYLSDASRGVNPSTLQSRFDSYGGNQNMYGNQLLYGNYGARGSYFNRSLDPNLYSHLNGGMFPYRSQRFGAIAGFNQPICNGSPRADCPNRVDQGMFEAGGTGVSCVDDVMYYTFENPNQKQAEAAYYRLGGVVERQGSSTMKSQYKEMGKQLWETFKYLPANIGYGLANGALGLADQAVRGVTFQTNMLANGLVGMGAAFQTMRYMPAGSSCDGSGGQMLSTEMQCACYMQCDWVR